MTKSKNSSRQLAWVSLNEVLQAAVPHFQSVVGDDQDFISLYIKIKEDGTCLAVLKSYGADGGPMVCFGSGYGLAGSIVALDATIQGGNWKVDKPWDGKAK